MTRENIFSLRLLLAALAGLAAFLVYLPSINNGFVIWDDPMYIYENPMIRTLDLRFLKWAVTDVKTGNWHPLTLLSFGIDHYLWGLEPMGYHLVNVILHSINTSLVFLLTHRLFRPQLTQPGALVASITVALLFGLHPAHVESVSWVSERKDVLYAFFFILSVIFYIGYAGGRRSLYAASLASFLLALLSKPMAVTLPAVLLILDFHPLGRLKDLKAALIEKAPFFALSLIFAIVCVYAQQQGDALMALERYPFQGRLSVPISALGFYLYKLMLPLKLAPFYPLPPKEEFFNAWFFLALLTVLTVSAASILLLKKYKALSAAWAYYIVALSPVLGVLQVGSQAAADRYTYLPALGPFMLAGAGAAALYVSLTKKSTKALFTAIFLSIFVLLSAKTMAQESVWKDSVSLWSHEIDLYPGRVATAYNNRGLAYDKAGDLKRAMDDMNSAVAADPGYAYAYMNRGIVFGEMQMLDKAMEDFNRAISIDPKSSPAYLNRGTAYLHLSAPERALDDFKRAVELDPGNAIAYFNMGLAYSNLNDPANSVKNIRLAAGLGLNEAIAYLKDR